MRDPEEAVRVTLSAGTDGSTVLLSDEKDGPALAAELCARGGAATFYSSVAELLRQRPLSSVSVLIVVCRPLPKGILLATLGRMNLEYPAMQKVVLVEGPLPLPIAEYLTASGVAVVQSDAGESMRAAERLAPIIRRLDERTQWIAA
jgi:hypothetical protein